MRSPGRDVQRIAHLRTQAVRSVLGPPIVFGVIGVLMGIVPWSATEQSSALLKAWDAPLGRAGLALCGLSIVAISVSTIVGIRRSDVYVWTSDASLFVWRGVLRARELPLAGLSLDRSEHRGPVLRIRHADGRAAEVRGAFCVEDLDDVKAAIDVLRGNR